MAKVCPLITFDPKHPESCIEHQCAFYTQIMGTHPQTGVQTAEWGCAIAWMPVLMIEAAQQARQAGASVDKLTNEVVREGERTRNHFQALADQSRRLRLEGN